jgi:beta-lactamase class C
MTGAGRIPSVLELIQRWIAEGGCLGGQVCVWQDGRVVADEAVGCSSPSRTASCDDVGRLYCAIKPITGCCLGRAVEAGEADFDDPARRFLPEFRSSRVGSITLRQLLTHTSGLPDIPYDPHVPHFRDRVMQAAAADVPPYLWHGEPRYNETLAWYILGVVVERIYGDDFANVVRQAIAEPAGLPDLRMVEPDPERYAPCLIVGGGAFQPVREPAQTVLFSHVNPAHGGFGTARDLCLFYAELVRCATGGGELFGAALVREMVGAHGTVHLGPGFGWRTMGLGYMTDVTTDGFGGGWSRHSFGHAALVGRHRVSYAFADLDHRIAAAIRLFSAGAKNNWRFQRLGAALWADMEPVGKLCLRAEPDRSPSG